MIKTLETPVRPSPAEIYEQRFVPALFEAWGPRVCAAAGVRAGQQVLDVACGTGAATLAAAARVGTAGTVVGVDANPDMLAVARRKRAELQWQQGRAEALPFPDASFDAVISQFGLMFFDDKVQALREMRRVLRPDGRIAVAVCDAVERSPGYAALAALLDRLFGRGVGDAFRAPFALGDANRLLDLCAAADLGTAQVARLDAEVRFASIDELVATERACVWTLGGLLDDAQFEQLRGAAATALAPFVEARSGAARFSMPGLVITARPAGDADTAIVERLYADFARGDVQSVLAALADEVEWTEAAGSPYGGTYHGAQQVHDAVFARLHADWDSFDVMPAETITEASRIVVIGSYRARHAASGRCFEAPFAHAWTLRDRRVIGFRQFADTALMNAAAA